MINNKFSEYSAFEWCDNLKRYITKNYYYQEDRFIQTFRYIELDENNFNTFSMEYSSILRDVGSIFGSALEEIYKNTDSNPVDYPNINNFRSLLLEHVNQIYGQLVYLKPLKHTGKYIIFPYSAFKNSNGPPEWWDAYNKVKHGDIHSYKRGNLKNTLAALAGTLLLSLNIKGSNYNESKLFDHYGLGIADEEDPEFKSKLLFLNP